MNYAKAIRVIRAALGVSQKELAKRAKLTPSYISLLESGARSPSAPTLRKLSKALKVPVPVFTLLACGKGDLRGVSEEQASVLARHLLDVLVSAEP